MAAPKKNILIIRYTSIKMFFQSLPAMGAIREYHKNDNLVLLTDETLFKYAKTIPLFDKVWLDIKPHWTEIPSVIDIIKRLRKGHFSRIYDLSFTQQANWYFRMIGFRKPEWNGNIKMAKFPYNPDVAQALNFQDYVRNQIAVAGVTNANYFDYDLLKRDISHLNLPQNYCVINAAGDKKKLGHKWSLFNYSEVIEYLGKQGIKVVLTGDNKDDYWLNQNLSKLCPNYPPIDLSGKTKIADLYSLMSNALFVLGNDTMPSHVAAFSHTKTVMLLSRFSPAELSMPKVPNLAVIEEPYLENVTSQRVIETLENFCDLKAMIEHIKQAPNMPFPKDHNLYKTF